jgi:ABC-type nitrate/sulfonate/bicarbonate transport system substrate-binding protein
MIQVYEDNPVTNIAREDLAITGKEELTGANIKASPFRSWIGLYALLYMIREAGLTEFTKESLTATIEASGEIPMLGLTRDWTPKTDHAGAFARIGNGQYYFYQFDAESVGFDGEPIYTLIGEGDIDEALCGTLGGPCA